MVNSAKSVAGPWPSERIDGAGHWMQLDAPAALNELLVGFFWPHEVRLLGAAPRETNAGRAPPGALARDGQDRHHGRRRLRAGGGADALARRSRCHAAGARRDARARIRRRGLGELGARGSGAVSPGALPRGPRPRGSRAGAAGCVRGVGGGGCRALRPARDVAARSRRSCVREGAARQRSPLAGRRSSACLHRRHGQRTRSRCVADPWPPSSC